ncbi:hypothetical protein Cp1R7AA1_061 [Mesorhizobium phage Cp1R7A-A1]|nr:hypothetical protein Cp1R7AA1_061 [Mesorhizobium phage Cp1R7A-A1]
MSNNAQWWVNFEVHLPSDHGGSGDTFTKQMSVASPDLVDTKEAHRRARVTAETRLKKWLAKEYPAFHKRMTIRHQKTQCVG